MIDSNSQGKQRSHAGGSETINPYHAYDFQRRLKAKPFGRVFDPSLVMALAPETVDSLLTILMPKISGQLVQSLETLRQIHVQACTLLEDCLNNLIADEQDELETSSITNYLIHQLSRTQACDDYVWPDPQTFADFVSSVTKEDRPGLDALMQAMTRHRCAEITGAPHAHWFEPLKLVELDQAVPIKGQRFIQDGDHWERVDQYVQRYKICVSKTYEVEDKCGAFGAETEVKVVGVAATLAGAIEVAELAIDALEPFDSSQSRLPDAVFPSLCQIIHAASEHPVLTATVETTRNRKDENYIFTAHNQWEHPLTPAQCEATRQKIRVIEAEIEQKQSSRSAFNHLINQRLVELQRLPAPGHDFERVSSTLRNTLAVLGKDQALATLLEMDLGL